MAGSRESTSRARARVPGTEAEVGVAEAGVAVGLRPSLIIDCDTCQMRDISCDDCVISFLIGPPAERPVLSLAEPEAQAMATLADVGLVPPLRLVAPTQSAD